MTHVRLRELSLDDFAARLAEKTPTPGGGSVAAHLVAVGAALGAMALRFTSGPKFAAVEPAMAPRIAELEELRAEAASLVDADAGAYEAVLLAYKLPKASEEDKARRGAAIQAGLRQAIDVPARTLELAARALRRLAEGAGDLNPNVASDCASGGWCLLGAAEAAFLNVQINAAALADKAEGAARLSACEERLRQTRASAEALRASIAAKIG